METNPPQYLEGLTANDMWARSHKSVRVVPQQYCRGDSSLESMHPHGTSTHSPTPLMATEIISLNISLFELTSWKAIMCQSPQYNFILGGTLILHVLFHSFAVRT
jgi:hypothetical protein